jgi:DNA-binding transcriptional ArsR family regulator
MNRTGPGLDTRLAKALSHPLRQRLLIAFARRVASPSEMATELGEPLGDVAYHVKRLVDLGCLELVRAERGRGGVKRFYTASARYEVEDAAWTTLSPSSRHSIAEPVAAQIVSEVQGAAADGRLGADHVHLSFVRLHLDERGLEALSTVLRSVVDEADRLERQSEQRSGAAARRPTALSIAHVPLVNER